MTFDFIAFLKFPKQNLFFFCLRYFETKTQHRLEMILNLFQECVPIRKIPNSKNPNSKNPNSKIPIRKILIFIKIQINIPIIKKKHIINSNNKLKN